MAKKKPAPAENKYAPKVIETFRDPRGYLLSSLMQEVPTCFNGIVHIKKYRITVELIEEPVEIYQERLEFLWQTSNNYHDALPLKAAAKEIGYEFKGSRGQILPRDPSPSAP